MARIRFPSRGATEQPEVASELLDLGERPPEPLALGPQGLGVWELAWPTMLSFLTQTMVRWVDFMMVGSLGPDALAAVGVGGQFYWLIQSIGAIGPTGVVVLLARAVGSGDARLVDASLRQGLWMATGISLVTMVIFLPLTDVAIALYGVNPAVVGFGSAYLYWLLWGTIPLSVCSLFATALRAAGDSRTPLAIGVVTNLLNALLNWVLIFGHFGVPALGVRGAAIASSLAMLFQMILFALLWRRGRLVVRPGPGSFRPDPGLIRRILRIGYPAAFEGAVFQIGMMGFMRLLGSFGTAAVAAYNVGAQILALSFLPGLGFSAAASTLVGQHLGNADPQRAARAGWRALAGAIASMSLLGIVIIALGERIAGLFSSNAEVIALTVEFIWILGAVQPLMAIEYTIGGALRGAGDTRFPLLAIFVGLFGFRLLPAFVAAHVFHAPLTLVWGMLIFDYLVKAVLLASRFARGRWMRLEL